MPLSGMHQAVGRGRERMVDCRYIQLKSPSENLTSLIPKISIYLLGRVFKFELGRGKLSERLALK